MKSILLPIAGLALAACASSGAGTTPSASASVDASSPACDSLKAHMTAATIVRAAEPLPGNPRPPYPNDAGISFDGRVTASFTVLTNGRADMSTFKVVQSDHDAFTQSLRNTLPEWRFRPAELAPGCRIAHTETLPFEFTTR